MSEFARPENIETIQQMDIQGAFQNYHAARENLAQARAVGQEAAEKLLAALAANEGKKANFSAQPSSYVKVFTRNDGGKTATMVPSHSLLDEERKPHEYTDCIIVGTEKADSINGDSLLVRYEGWGEDYEYVPISTIRDFELVQTEGTDQ